MHCLLYFVCHPQKFCFDIWAHSTWPAECRWVWCAAYTEEAGQVGDLLLKGSSRSPPGKRDPGRTAAKAGSAQGGGGKPGPSPTLRSRPARSRTVVSHTAGRCTLEDTDNGRCSHTRRRFGNAEVRCHTLGLWHSEEKGKQKTKPPPHTYIG